MTLDEYQERAVSTAIYPGQGTYLGLSYVNAKLNGEAGEVSEHVGKILRDDYGPEEFHEAVFMSPIPLSVERRGMLLLELGDVLWYVAAMAKELDLTLEQLAEVNLEKLALRKARGKLSGSGSDR